MRRRLLQALLLVAVAISLSGCAYLMPRTAEIIEPHGFEDLIIAIGADIEQLIELIGTYGWAGIFML